MQDRLRNGPGRLISIGDIPAAVVDDHNQVFYYWQHSGIRKSTLFHVDGHHDLGNGAPYIKGGIENQPDYYKLLSIAGFIVPSFYYGFIDSIWWLNPHSFGLRLQFIGARDIESERVLLAFKHSNVSEDSLRLCCPNFPSSYVENGIVKAEPEIDIKHPLILDIDIDAFCCDKRLHGVLSTYEGIRDYEKRISETMDVLKTIKRKPNLITIALSNGRSFERGREFSNAFVPKEFSDDVERRVLQGLVELYC